MYAGVQPFFVEYLQQQKWMSDDIGMNAQQYQDNNLPVFEKKQLLDVLDLQSPLVMSTGKPGVILGWPRPLPFKTHHPAYGYGYLAGMGMGFKGVSRYKTHEG